jgi:SNF family Na+-dependent transporter
MEENVKRKKVFQFSSIFGTYIILLGYSIGASDIWRFPLMVQRNGGGEYTIYIIMSAPI